MPALRPRLLTILALLCCCYCSSALAQVLPLRIGSWDRDSDPLTAVSEAVLSRAYAELGQPLEFVALPNRRALQALLAGELDGNLHRVRDVATTHPGLLRVAPPINASAVRIYTYDAKLAQPQDWAQLQGLRVAYQRGVLRIEQMLPAGARRVEAGSVNELFRLLDAGIADLALCTEPDQAPPLRRLGKLRRLEQALEEHLLYHYLSGRHVELVPRLAAVLQKLQASGELDAIRQAALQAYMRQHPVD
ncbi:substrate-binding periplasmic protein [Paucibacter soli]|uniref:substrate-binding periplasmic protein n=1 Tax=Paucibacter soli TaxID=3133433 RepID=UPI0030AB2344